jgi:hypothetical protein
MTIYISNLSRSISSIPSKTEADFQTIWRYINAFGRHRQMLRLKNAVVISTFAGENSLFGKDCTNTAWSFVKHELQSIVPVGDDYNLHTMRSSMYRYILFLRFLWIRLGIPSSVRWMEPTMWVFTRATLDTADTLFFCSGMEAGHCILTHAFLVERSRSPN